MDNSGVSYHKVVEYNYDKEMWFQLSSQNATNVDKFMPLVNLDGLIQC